jgi:hypothetical protein
MATSDPYINNTPVPASIGSTILVPPRSLQPGQSLMGHQQKIPANKAITGILPDDGSPTVKNGMMKWACTNDGGLFDFGVAEPLVVFLTLDLGDSSACSVYVVNMDDNNTAIAGELIKIASGTGVIQVTTPIRLTSRQVIKVVANASSTGMLLWAKALLENGFRG